MRSIIIVGDYNRVDFLYVAKLLSKEIDFYFIEYLNENELTNKECLKYGKVLYWKDYRSAYELLEIIKPEKVVFYFLESFNHVALNVACKVNKVPVFHLEHGLRFSVNFYKSFNKSVSISATKVSTLKKIKSIPNLFDKYKNRKFFLHTQKESPNNENNFLKNYFLVRSSNSIFDTFQIIKDSLRLPDRYISFSPLIFNYHREFENLPENYPVSYIGIPQFDHFFNLKQLKKSGQNILFIDQPFHEQSVYNWTADKKKSFLRKLLERTSPLGKKLYIKPHPMSDLSVYATIEQEGSVEIVTDNWDEVVPVINTVLGFSSTLLLPFIAMDSINCFLLEMHPEQGEEPYSQFLLNSGACHAVFSFEDLEEKLKNWDSWNVKQKQYKEQFVHDYMYKFDGNSSERLKSILRSEAS